jgi:hypothetical protein
MINICDEYTSCFYSSFIFLTNVIVAYWYEYYFYGRLFFLLITTSILFHSIGNNIYSNINDKIAILAIVLYGGYLFFHKFFNNKTSVKYWVFSFFIVSAFLLTLYLFIYGYITNSFCFYEDIKVANLYHSLLHIISSIGHNLIIMM